jgi:DHA1 family multidrug resistance protein-like MFS transporter
MVTFVFNTTLCVWIIRKTFRPLSLTVLVAVCALSAVCTLLIPDLWLFIICCVLVYAGYSVSIPVLQSMVADQAEPAQKNLVMGFYNAAKSLGSVIGSLTVGFIYSLHAKLPFACVALIYGLCVLVALGYWLFGKRRK